MLPLSALRNRLHRVLCGRQRACGAARRAARAPLRPGPQRLHRHAARHLDRARGRARSPRRCPAHCASWECRNNRLAWHGLQPDGFLQAVDERARALWRAVASRWCMGTSTSSIGATEEGYRRLAAGRPVPRRACAAPSCIRCIRWAASCRTRCGSPACASRWPPPAHRARRCLRRPSG